MKTVAVLVNDEDKQYEGLRSSLGMMLYNTFVQMFLVDKEIANMDEAYRDNMEFLDEMEGERYSNNRANVEKYGFNTPPLKRWEKCSGRRISSFRFRRIAKMKILYVLRTRPDVTVEKFMQTVTNGDQSRVRKLYEDKIDWSKLVDDIFDHDKVISWW
jgi:hypothetical protein